MNWYKITKLATARTLYHGTSINNYDSIKQVGLVPHVGDFVSDSYAGEYEAAGVDFDPIPLVYAADKEEIRKAHNAMTYAVSKMLGRGFHDVSNEELRAYGMLVIIREGADFFEQRPKEEIGPWGDWQGETDNQYPAVEPGDYYSEGGAGHKDIKILIGNKMVEFFKKMGIWDFSEDELRKELLQLAIRYHKKNISIPEIQQKIQNLSNEEVKSYYDLYKNRITELSNSPMENK